MLSGFSGLDPNGTWTLYVADVSGGDLHQLNSWGLDFANPVVVPEPTSVFVLGGFLTLMLVLRQNRK